MTRNIRHRNSNARIALIGWSGASLWTWDALTELNQSDEMVDLIVYPDSNWIKTRVAREGHPANFGRAVLIYRRFISTMTKLLPATYAPPRRRSQNPLRANRRSLP